MDAISEINGPFLADPLWVGERRLWTGDVADQEALLHAAVMIVLPDVPRILRYRAAMRAFTRDVKWASVSFEDRQAVQIGTDLVTVGYLADAQAPDGARRQLVCTSMWCRSDARWLLLQHHRGAC